MDTPPEAVVRVLESRSGELPPSTLRLQAEADLDKPSQPRWNLISHCSADVLKIHVPTQIPLSE